MNPSDGFDRTVSAWLHADAEHRVPQHLDAVLRRTRTERQRPAWSSLERWLPVQATLRLAPVPRIAWLLVVLALLVALGVALLAVGSRPHLPAPFGLARNGAILYDSADHDVYTMDPVTGATKALITGSTRDHDPWLSPDGTRLFFLRDSTLNDHVVGGYEPIVMVANVDGSHVRPLTGELVNLQTAGWSSDGSQIFVASDVESKPTLEIFSVDGTSGPRVIDIGGMSATFVQFRPGDRELTFRGTNGDVAGVYAVGVDGNGLRPILPPTANSTLDYPALSPDGTKIAYQEWATDHGVLHVIDVDSRVDRTPAFDGVAADLGPIWSPDGTRLLFFRVAGSSYHLATAPASGGPVVETGPAMPILTGTPAFQFSPDGTKIIAFYPADHSIWMLDVTGGAGKQLPATIGATTWQRLAP